MSAVGRTAPVLDTLMIEPRPRAFIASPTSAESRNGPLRLTPITLSQSSSLTSVRRSYSGDMPALLTSTSTPPFHASAVRASSLDVRPSAGVAGDADRFGAGIAQLGGRGLAGILLAARDDDGGAGAGERLLTSPIRDRASRP